jgi:hypothetical protein
LYQNSENGILVKFRNFEKEFDNLKSEKKVLYAKEYNEAFLIFYEAFFHHYNLFWIQSKHNHSLSPNVEMEIARVFFEYCNVHISKINTHYLQPLTIKKANKSILYGKISVGIGVIATIFSFCFSNSSNSNIESFKQDILNKVSNNSIDKETVTVIDSLVKLNNVHLSRLIGNLPVDSNSNKKSNRTNNP